MPRRKAKAYYREAYNMFADRLQTEGGRLVNQCKDRHGTPEFDKNADGTNDLTKPKIKTDQDEALRSGWPADPDLVPVFLTEDEASVTPSWQDYNRLVFTATFLPAGTGSTRTFIMVQAKCFRLPYFSYTPAGDDQGYDLTRPPIRRRLTRAQEERYWSELPSEGNKLNWHDLKRFSVALGISPDGFQLGTTSAQKTDTAKATYLIGLAIALNPYASVHIAESTSDGRHFRPAIGFGLDVDIISKIFGGAK